MRSFRPSPALVISLVALFVSLGGGAYALSIPKNSVGSKQLKPGAVHDSDLAGSAITTSKVKDGSLLRKDFKAGQLPAGPRGAAAASFLSARFQESEGMGYAAPVGTSTKSLTESDVSMVSPAKQIVARDLFVLSDDAPAYERTYTLIVNGTAKTLSCPIPGSTIGNLHKACSDSTHAVSIPAGSTISLREGCSADCPGGGTGMSGFARVGWRATTP